MRQDEKKREREREKEEGRDGEVKEVVDWDSIQLIAVSLTAT